MEQLTSWHFFFLPAIFLLATLFNNLRGALANWARATCNAWVLLSLLFLQSQIQALRKPRQNFFNFGLNRGAFFDHGVLYLAV